MECNKDEAARAKEIAEKKFKAKDLEGARKFAVKASQLYPALEGIPQMLATLDVYAAAEKKVNGETDWYEILCVNALADDETVKKQYRKLALMLHPDKNKSVGAEGAFKLISEAWSVLSDKFRRSVYDHKRNLKGVPQKVAQPRKPASAPRTSSSAHGANGFYNTSNSNGGSNARTETTTSHAGASARGLNGLYKFSNSEASSDARTQKPAPRAPPPPSHRPSKPNTFWTSCNRCRMQYEYLRVYVNHNLLCPNCHQPFLAIETGTVPSASGTFPWTSPQQHGKKTHVQGRDGVVPGGYPPGQGADSFHKANFQWGAFSRTAGAPSANASTSAAAAAANVVHQTYEKVRREREEAQAAARKEDTRRNIQGSKRSSGGSENCIQRPDKKRSIDRDSLANDNENEHIASKDTYEAEKLNGVSSGAGRFPYKQYGNSLRDLVMQDARSVLMTKARNEIQKKLEDWKKEAAEKASEKEKGLSNTKENLVSNGNGNVHDHGKSDEFVKKSKKQKSSREQDDSSDVPDEEPDVPSSINVIDPDFYDFDKDRSEKSFEPNQVWAAYDDDDGMPRFYALIQKVISVNPFKMRISWLNSKSNSDIGPLNWVACGFTKTSGEFRVGRYEVHDNVNVFSHKVRWEKGLRGVIRILPGKGDVWALYRNWSTDWNESTPDEVVHKYDMVEVVGDFVDDTGVAVAPLIKLPSFKTVFRRNVDTEGVQTIPREELFRFSHQVPARLLTGEEAESAPKGCLELDPAAIPMELLEVVTEVKDEKAGQDARL
ncbi:DnaJ-like protein subfamily B member 12 [Nymphaea thermarum]|nr:DnaJ-like protein subfamily B member 12 [Nymphaea thermarum]